MDRPTRQLFFVSLLTFMKFSQLCIFSNGDYALTTTISYCSFLTPSALFPFTQIPCLLRIRDAVNNLLTFDNLFVVIVVDRMHFSVIDLALVVVCGAVPGAASFSIAGLLMAAALVLSTAIVIVYSCVMCITKCRKTGQTRDIALITLYQQQLIVFL